MVVGLQFVGGNVASTAPYSHGRRFDTLEEVIDFYGRGGAALVSWVKKGGTIKSLRQVITSVGGKALKTGVPLTTDKLESLIKVMEV
ncbi:uncharacterized protein METZ01_LOCUS410733 [marine metagenome]|jgi:cytochrome c peroxidase|uniref:Uncharacterized protein n=1 Tax=marine metagenome TaxID=408172 RepID=A0A382WGT6_9ZZZZ|tara:strand:- start:969 stop:1229 length:261 start_codon:yes stop_codon:yes gene_type:complete